MTLNELSRFYWARMHQAYFMHRAFENHEIGRDSGVLLCLLEWWYYKDIGDAILESHDYNALTNAMVLMEKGETT